MILLCLYTGIRHEAALSMRWTRHKVEGFINLDRMEIHRVGWGEQKTSKNRYPRSRICGPIRAHLRAWAGADRVGKPGQETYLIRKQHGDAYKGYVDRQFAKIVERAGLDPDIVWHCLRHTTATWFAVIGMPMHVSAGLIGHSLETLMEVYLHWAPESQENADAYWLQDGGRRLLHVLSKAPAHERRRRDKDLSPAPGRVRARPVLKRVRAMLERAS